MSGRRLGRRLAAATLATALALVGLELGWRALRTSGFGPTTNPLIVERDERLGWRHRPGARVRHRTADFDVEVAIAANGFRDATPATAADRPLVTLGDSLTFGWGVPERAAFPALLEERTGVPVQNLGVSGYGTGQELLLYAEAGAALDPRAVVLVVCGNDVEEASRRASYGRAKPFFPGPRLAPGAEVPPAREGLLVRHSHVARSLAKALAGRARTPLAPAEVAAGRARVAGLIEALGRLAPRAADGGPALLAVHDGQAWLEAPLAGAGIATLDAAEVLAAADGPVRFERDPHWNERGHGIVAAAVAARLRALGLLEAR